jgi:hypothetical protein
MPLEVFYSYAHQDEKLRDEIEKNLALLQRTGLIVGWHDRRIGAGGSWKEEIDAHVHSAQIILLLISSDFLASDYCYGVEMRVALERHARHEAIVIPIILRPVDWTTAPFAHLQALPRDAKAVTTWSNQDEALADIARNIRETVQRFRPSESGIAPAPVAVKLQDTYVPKPRVLDAALPSRIVKDQVTQLLVLIRLPESKGLVGTVLADEDSEAGPEDVRSKPFRVTFPRGRDGRAEALKVTVRLTSPDFSPPSQKKNIFVPPEEDSQVCTFLLTPLRSGKLTVLVELQWEDVLHGQRSLKTECVAYVPRNTATFDDDPPPPPAPGTPEAPAASGTQESPGMNVVRMEVNAGLGAIRVLTSRVPTLGSLKSRNNKQINTEPRVAMRMPDVSMEPLPGAPDKGRSPKKHGVKTAIAVALIGAVSAITVAYFQYGPWSKAASSRDVVLRWRVMNAHTKEFVPDARVSVALDSANGSIEKFADSSGNVFIDLGEVKPDTHGRLYVHVDGYQPLEKDFVVSSSTANEELRLEPLKSPPPTPHTKPGSNILAGRIVDSSANVGLSHASISLAGRTETNLTDDNGNFRMGLAAPFPSEVRMQVKKVGCAPLDQVVRPGTEGLTLELNCAHKN